MAAVEQYLNNPQTSLDGGIDAVVTTLTVSSNPTSTPASGQFRILIGDEYMLVTAVAGLNWTVTRGIEGSTAASHADLSVVVAILTAEGLKGLVRESLNGTNIAARRELNFVDGNGVTWALTDDPTNNKVDIEAEVAATSGFEAALVVPVLSDWTLLDQRTFSDAYQLNGAVLSRGWHGGYGTQECHGIYRAVPATPWVATFRVRFYGYGSDFSFGAVYLDNPPVKIASGITFAAASSGNICGHKWTNVTTYSGNYQTLSASGATNIDIWLRLSDNGTNRLSYISPDGTNWQLVHTVGRTDFLTCGNVGLLINPSGSAAFVTAILTSFSF